MLAGARYDSQYHLPQARLDIEIAQAAHGPAAAVALAAETLQRYELAVSSPRYVWPLLVAAASAACEAPGEDAAALFDRLRTLAGKLEAFGPVQRAWQLSFAANCARADSGTGTAGPAVRTAAANAADRLAAANTGDRLTAADAAVAAWEAVGQPYPTALALVGAAAAAPSGPAGREAAARRRRRAAPIAESLGARPLVAQIAGLGRQAAGAGPGRDGLGLTAREIEVLRLVANGQSNREIAAALFIAPKTASVHVSNILAKLDTATRTEAAARAHALRLFD